MCRMNNIKYPTSLLFSNTCNLCRFLELLMCVGTTAFTQYKTLRSRINIRRDRRKCINSQIEATAVIKN